MSIIEIKVPGLPESVVDATVAAWHKQSGEWVDEGDSLLDLETDKIMLEVPAPHSGLLVESLREVGDTVVADDLLARIDTQANKPEPSQVVSEVSVPTAAPAPSASSTPAPTPGPTPAMGDEDRLSPAVRRLVHEHQLQADRIPASGPGGRLTKADVMAYLAHGASSLAARHEERVPMSRLRARVAERLLEVQQNAAILTTFNEVNMQPVMDLRARYKTLFEETHDVRLGFMSFFVKAAVSALQKFPVVNASMDGQDVVYHRYCDIGIAVSSPRGLVVPVLRDAQQMSMADIEQGIMTYAKKAKDATLTLEDMQGGTFTITNGGVFGSMLSTPIINPPQSAILGMHNIVKRVVVEDDAMVIRPMMYLALSYDHRLIDGAQSVQFLVTMKQLLEDPARLLLDV